VWGEGIDRLLAVRIGGESYYPLTDVQGTVWGYVDSQNNIVARWQYDAWGNVVDEEVSVPALAAIRYRFQGREWSAATGLVNFRMRWYDSETGRWLSKDLIGLSGGLNLYAFCACAPLGKRDLSGLVDLNLFPRNERILQYANNHNIDDRFVVGAHGNMTGIFDANDVRVPVAELARRIRIHPKFAKRRGMPVQLDSCDVGNGPYPQQLADELHVMVFAPDSRARYDISGNVTYHTVYFDGREASGELLAFEPVEPLTQPQLLDSLIFIR
jgi:RHS repeat-associated protein